MLEQSEFSLEETCKSTSYLANLREVIQTHPCDSARNLGLSIITAFNEETEIALEHLKSLVRENPEIPLLHRRIAEFYIDGNEFEEAIIHLEKVIELQTKDLTARFWLCLIYLLRGEKEKAKEPFKYLKDFIYQLQVITKTWREE